MSGQVIRALVPPVQPLLGRPSRLRRVAFGEVFTAVREEGLRFAVSAVDAKGRVSIRALIAALAWEPAAPMAARMGHGFVAIGPGEGSAVSVDDRGRVGVPPVLWRGCGVVAGDAVFVVAALEHGLVVVHPVGTLAEMTRRHHLELDARANRREAGL